MGRTVRVACTSYAAGNAPMRFGLARGLFAGRGVDLVMDEYPRGGAAIGALNDGTADIAVASGLPILHAATHGADPVIVMSIENENVFAVIGAEGVTAPERLRGRRVGISGANDQDGVIMRRALRDWGLDPQTDVTMVHFDGGRGAIWKALVAGEVSAMAATIPEPVHARVVGLPILRDFAQEHEPYQAGSVVIRRDYGERNRLLVRDVLAAQLDSIRMFGADIDAALPSLRQCTRIEHAEVLRTVGQLFAEAMLRYVPAVAPLAAVARDVVTVAGTPIDVDLDRIVDPSYVADLA